jgi:hypothetical protein
MAKFDASSSCVISQVRLYNEYWTAHIRAEMRVIRQKNDL